MDWYSFIILFGGGGSSFLSSYLYNTEINNLWIAENLMMIILVPSQKMDLHHLYCAYLYTYIIHKL